MRKNIHLLTIFLLAAGLLMAACAPKPTPAPAESPQGAGIANPASENCVKQGGQSQIVKAPDGGEYGICVFDDNRQCEEWTMMRGDCPVGGIKITGYVTDAAVYCAITGGEYTVTGASNAENEQGSCSFKNGKSCDVWKYYQGECAP